MFQLDLKSRKSIYEQVVDNVKELIITGVLKAESKLPSVRELSRTLTVNPNTIQKAYRELEHQGFIYGFRLAMGLFIGNERPYGKSQFEEHIRSEYSTLMVSDLDRTDQVVDILKDHIPESRLEDAINTLCACVNDTKYAVFEQGFLRGIAVARGDGI